MSHPWAFDFSTELFWDFAIWATPIHVAPEAAIAPHVSLHPAYILPQLLSKVQKLLLPLVDSPTKWYMLQNK